MGACIGSPRRSLSPCGSGCVLPQAVRQVCYTVPEDVEEDEVEEGGRGNRSANVNSVRDCDELACMRWPEDGCPGRSHKRSRSPCTTATVEAAPEALPPGTECSGGSASAGDRAVGGGRYAGGGSGGECQGQTRKRSSSPRSTK